MGQLQWLISPERFDVSSAVAALSTFRSKTRIGHPEPALRVVGYVAKYTEVALRFRVEVSEYNPLPQIIEDWDKSVHGNDHDEFVHNMPTPLRKLVRLTEFVDAKLYFDLITGRSCTGLLIFMNQTPIDWHYKKQSPVASATLSFEFVAVKMTIEKGYDPRYTHRMMGIPVDYTTYVIGDNAAVTIQTTIPHSQLGRRHDVLAYHYTRESIATGMIHMFHVTGITSPVNCVTKFLVIKQGFLSCTLCYFGSKVTWPGFQQKGSDSLTHVNYSI
jgi:hypothetical protein